MNIDDLKIDEMNLKELKSFSMRIEVAIETFKQRAVKSALSEIIPILDKHGLTIQDIVNPDNFGKQAKIKATRKVPVPAKYAHPDRADITWSGRGRKPVWFEEAIKSGRTKASMEIG